MKKQLSVTLAIIVGVLIGIALIAGNPIENPKRIVVVANSLYEAQSKLKLYLDQGFLVESITPESVSTSIKTRGYRDYNGGNYSSGHRDVKGGFLIILVKKIKIDFYFVDLNWNNSC